jgi:hypothetical protein
MADLLAGRPTFGCMENHQAGVDSVNRSCPHRSDRCPLGFVTVAAIFFRFRDRLFQEFVRVDKSARKMCLAGAI